MGMGYVGRWGRWVGRIYRVVGMMWRPHRQCGDDRDDMEMTQRPYGDHGRQHGDHRVGVGGVYGGVYGGVGMTLGTMGIMLG